MRFVCVNGVAWVDFYFLQLSKVIIICRGMDIQKKKKYGVQWSDPNIIGMAFVFCPSCCISVCGFSGVLLIRYVCNAHSTMQIDIVGTPCRAGRFVDCK